MCDTCNCGMTDSAAEHDHGQHRKVVEVQQSLLAANTARAGENRKIFKQIGAVALNLISSPGAGKTTLLEHTIDRLGREIKIGVIEGDIETERDAERIRAKGVPTVQLTTGGACHLDAGLVRKGLQQLIDDNGPDFDLIFIENVGNLVCPAAFDLGEEQRIVLLSVPEGSDKPAKYPLAFRGSQMFLITKTDLLPYFNFSPEESRREALLLNPDLDIMELAATRGDGMDEWVAYLKKLVQQR